MTTEVQPASTSTDDGLVEIPACDNPAVAFCCEAWFRAHDEALEDGESEVVARVAGHEAYREAMPPLTGERNIRNYIACVVHGTAINAILGEMATKLLYGAQVAHAARRRTKPNKKTNKKKREKTSQTRTSAASQQFPVPSDTAQVTNPE